MSATKNPTGAVEVLRRYYDAIDSKRTDEALASFAPEATVRAGNQPARPWMEGLEAMARELRGVAATRHEITRVIEGPDGEAACELDIAYLLETGEEITLSGAAFCEIREGRFHRQHLYVDLAPVRDALGRER